MLVLEKIGLDTTELFVCIRGLPAVLIPMAESPPANIS
jgi:hypothetical protein